MFHVKHRTAEERSESSRRGWELRRANEARAYQRNVRQRVRQGKPVSSFGDYLKHRRVSIKGWRTRRESEHEFKRHVFDFAMYLARLPLSTEVDGHTVLDLTGFDGYHYHGQVWRWMPIELRAIGNEWGLSLTPPDLHNYWAMAQIWEVTTYRRKGADSSVPLTRIKVRLIASYKEEVEESIRRGEVIRRDELQLPPDFGDMVDASDEIPF